MNNPLITPAYGSCEAVKNLDRMPDTPPKAVSRLTGATSSLVRYQVPVHAVVAVASAVLAIVSAGRGKAGQAIAWSAVTAIVLGDKARVSAMVASQPATRSLG